LYIIPQHILKCKHFFLFLKNNFKYILKGRIVGEKAVYDIYSAQL